ncbi:membrane-spanning 4-domains subfamily A member 6D-like [Dasypus novemcinctus]|uniref:membrane-spanning 4-domains subfamily A member 6D-like n=1 Tax=Dasypus novemcinctus TaxID=9361 RepID=UPI00265F8A47|nr:membrane-spanning 4-domains subfamily A member 6D-like [Dasypus novemcinctus]
MKSGYPFVGAVCYIICGLLSVISEKKPTKCLAWSRLVTSVVSLVTAAVGFVLLALRLAATTHAWRQCELDAVPTQKPPEDHFDHVPNVIRECFRAGSALLGVLSVMCIFTVLALGAAVPTSIVWWRLAQVLGPGSLPWRNEISSQLS